MIPARVIQKFVRTCSDCPNCVYYSGGMHECTITYERISPSDKKERVGHQCPLPFAGPIVPPAPHQDGDHDPSSVPGPLARVASSQMVEAAARAMDPELFSDDPETARRAASPLIVDRVRDRVREVARTAIEAALSSVSGLGQEPGSADAPSDFKPSSQAENALPDIDKLAYRFWSIHPSELDEYEKTMPVGYDGGVRAWFFASEMRKLLNATRDPASETKELCRAAKAWANLETERQYRLSCGSFNSKEEDAELFEAEEILRDAAIQLLRVTKYKTGIQTPALSEMSTDDEAVKWAMRNIAGVSDSSMGHKLETVIRAYQAGKAAATLNLESKKPVTWGIFTPDGRFTNLCGENGEDAKLTGEEYFTRDFSIRRLYDALALGLNEAGE